MIIDKILDRFYSKQPSSKELAAVDVSGFPYKVEQDFEAWLKNHFALSAVEPERISRRLAVARFSVGDEFKFSPGAEEYIAERDESTFVGLETVTYDLNAEGRELVGEIPLDIDADIVAGTASQTLLKSRVKHQLRNVGYNAERTAKSQLALAELRKHGYLAPKFYQTIDLGVYTDAKKESLSVIGEVTKVTYVVDLQDEKLVKALSKMMAAVYVGEKAVHLELVDA